MLRVKLWFSGNSSVELIRSEIFHSDSEQKLVSIRGRVGIEQGTFLWTTAVRALSLLIIGTKLGGEFALLNSDLTSLATSLDYSLDKAPLWMNEMFGSDKKGEPSLKRTLLRINPNRKRAGPVLLSFRPNKLPSENIELVLNTKLVVERDQIEFLYNNMLTQQPTNSLRIKRSDSGTSEIRLNGSGALDPELAKQIVVPGAWESYVNEFGPAHPFLRPIPLHEERYLNMWQAAVNSELDFALAKTRTFSTKASRRNFDLLRKDDRFLKLSNSNPVFSSEEDINVQHNSPGGSIEGLNRLKELLCSDKPLSCLFPGAKIGSTALFFVLKYISGVPISWNSALSPHDELLYLILSDKNTEESDLMVLGIAQTGVLGGFPKSHRFRPLMVLPDMSYRRVRPGNTAVTSIVKERKSELVESCHDYSNFYSGHLWEAGYLREKSPENFRVPEPLKFIRLAESDRSFESVMWFPDYIFAKWFFGAECEELTPIDSRTNDDLDEILHTKSATSVLLAHERIWKTPQLPSAICHAIRYAWVMLQGSRPLREFVANSIANHIPFQRAATRGAGLHVLLKDAV